MSNCFCPECKNRLDNEYCRNKNCSLYSKYKMESKGVKYDDGKLDFTLLPYEAIQEVVKVLMYGANKYPEADNWKRVDNPRHRYNKAAFRHLFSEVNGETLDPESGLYHLAHAVCSNLFALHFAIQENKIIKDNEIEFFCRDCAFTHPIEYSNCLKSKDNKEYKTFKLYNVDENAEIVATRRIKPTIIIGECHKCNDYLYSETNHICKINGDYTEK